MCSATFIPAENSALLYLHVLIAKWTTAIVSKFIAFLKGKFDGIVVVIHVVFCQNLLERSYQPFRPGAHPENTPK